MNFSTGTFSGSELAAEIRIPVVLSQTAGVDIEVPLQFLGSATSGDSGVAGVDYFGAPASITISAGSLSSDVVLVPVDDGLPEAGESIVITLGQPSFGNLGGQAQASIELLDGPGPGGGTSGPFGSVLMLATNLVDLEGPQVHTAQDQDASAQALSPAGVQVLSQFLSPDGMFLAYEGWVPAQFVSNLYLLSSTGGPIGELWEPGSSARGPVTWSPDSSCLAYASGISGAPVKKVVIVQPDGSDPVEIQAPGGQFELHDGSAFLRWSGDSQRMAFLARVSGADPERLYVMNRDGSEVVEVSAGLEPNATVDGTFRWSSDGQWMAFISDNRLYVAPSGGGALQLIASDLPNLAAGGDFAYRFQWSPFGAQLVYVENVSQLGFTRLFAVTIPGGTPAVLSTNTGTIRRGWSWSPDGALVAYFARHSSLEEVLHVALPDGTGNWQVSGEHDVLDLRWSPDSAYLAYRATDGGPEGLYTADAGGSQWRLVSNGDVPTEEVVAFEGYRWAPDSTRLSFLAEPFTVPGSFELASVQPEGEQRLSHLGPLTGGDSILDHRWKSDAQTIYAHVGISFPTQFVKGLRALSVDGGTAEVDMTSNLYGGSGSVSEFFVR